jgi:hypothetical protein
MFNDIIGLTGLQTIMKCETGRVIVAQCGVQSSDLAWLIGM